MKKESPRISITTARMPGLLGAMLLMAHLLALSRVSAIERRTSSCTAELAREFQTPPVFCERTDPGAEFTPGEPLGINVEEIAALNTLGNRVLARTGFLDVTKAPFSADSTGARDCTAALREAIDFGRYHKLAVYFPAGTYLVSDTLVCLGGWKDERAQKWLPYTDMWPCVLVGDRRSGKHPMIRLAPHSRAFQDRKNPKPVLLFGSGSTGFHQLLYGLDIEIGEGNPGAAAVSFDCAEGSTIQDCVFRVGEGYAGVLKGPGSGGAVCHLEVTGGEVALDLCSTRPVCTVVGCRFEGQRRAVVRYGQRGPLTLVGCEFLATPGVPVLVSDSVSAPQVPFLNFGSAGLVDCRIDYSQRAAAAQPAVVLESACYMRNTWIRNAATLCAGAHTEPIALAGEGWHCVRELSCPYTYKKDNGWTVRAKLYLEGAVQSTPLIDIAQESVAPPADLHSRHLWNETGAVHWQTPKIANVKDRAYGAVGDGRHDDTAALQKAIDENERVFLPKGAYRVSRTLRLKADTKLVGVSPAYSMIVPMEVEGGDFTNPQSPQPVLRTADTAEASTCLAFFSVFMPREIAQGCYTLEWRCGGKSFVRCFGGETALTENEVAPLKKGVYPWHNWRWKDLEDFCLTTGHPKMYIDTPPGEDTCADRRPNWAYIQVRGHGGGGFFPYCAQDGRVHGSRFRRILVEGIGGPFALYQAQLQYGVAEMEIADSAHVTLYGLKSEKLSPALIIRNSQNILVTGVGGPFPPNGKVRITNSRSVTIANMLGDQVNDAAPLLWDTGPDGRVTHIPACAMYKSSGQPGRQIQPEHTIDKRQQLP